MIHRWAVRLVIAFAIGSAAAMATPPLRVCATLNNFPLSDRSGSGFENKLAALTAHALMSPVSYTWWPARANFLDRTLKKSLCDVVMGVPAGLEDVDTTHPYYRSSYVFLSRKDRISSLRDQRLKRMRIGVYLIGDDQTPPGEALAREGLSSNLTGFMTYFDRTPTGRSKLVTALQDGSIDAAAVWGPLAGYYAKTEGLVMTPISDDRGFAPLQFQFSIAMGVRKGDAALRRQLDAVIAEHQQEINGILRQYGVPLLTEQYEQHMSDKRSYSEKPEPGPENRP